MHIKDYYQTLKVGRKASTEEIKKSYRSLAHHFHPDKNKDNSFASEYFLEIQEAYEVLSHASARQAYDRERGLSGMDRVQEKALTPQALLRQVQQLADDVRRMTAYRIDISWLQSALLFLLRRPNIMLLSAPGMLPLRQAFLTELIFSLHPLHFPFPEEITQAVSLLVAQDKEAQATWEHFLAQERKKHLMRKVTPWLAVVITLAVCLLMYSYGKR